jgi:hypothetical protein
MPPPPCILTGCALFVTEKEGLGVSRERLERLEVFREVLAFCISSILGEISAYFLSVVLLLMIRDFFLFCIRPVATLSLARRVRGFGSGFALGWG